MRQCLCSTLINIVGYHCPNQELKAVLAALGGRNQNQGDGCNIVADCCIHIAQKMIAEQISRGCTANIWFKNSSQAKKKIQEIEIMIFFLLVVIILVLVLCYPCILRQTECQKPAS